MRETIEHQVTSKTLPSQHSNLIKELRGRPGRMGIVATRGIIPRRWRDYEPQVVALLLPGSIDSFCIGLSFSRQAVRSHLMQEYLCRKN